MLPSRAANLFAVCAVAIPMKSADATEAVAGRYVPGMYAVPGAGIVPPVPGLYWGNLNIAYKGDADFSVPIGGITVDGGIDAFEWVTSLIGIWVPQQDLPGNWTYAFQGVLPFGFMDTEARILTPIAVERQEDTLGLGDISVTPLLFGWHNDAANTFLSASFTILAPTGAWEQGALSFVGLNYWTFTPAFGFTHVTQDGWDFSGKLGIDINTENEDTDYHSGSMAHLDLALTKSVTETFSLGAISGFLYQFEDDDSTFADTRRDGFKGRSIAVGPLVKYTAKFDDDTEVDFTLSWAHEVYTKNRMQGDAVFLNASGKF